MSGGRLTRYAVLLVLLVLAPIAGAANPTSGRSAGDSTDGQDISDLAMDPTGQFVAAVVAFDAAKSSTPAAPPIGIPGAPSTTNNHKDVYVCDYGAPPANGTTCRGLRHSVGTLATDTHNYPQHVDATFVDAGGRQGRYAVAGPDGRISLWSHTSDTPSWSVEAQENRNALNITISSDASRVVAATAGTTGAGNIEVRYGSNGSVVWGLPLANAAGAGVRPTSIDLSRTGNVLAIGTSDGLLLADPSSQSIPSGQLGGISQVGSVNKVALSGNGQYVVAAASNGVFLAQVTQGAKPSVSSASVFNRGFSENGASVPAQEVAISVDGSRFAAAAGNKIYFFRRLDTGAVAEPVGQPYDAGARVASLAYDDRGSLLVAVAGENVIGFGANSNEALWSFNPVTLGTLDGPLRKVAVSDDAQRIVIAGKTKTMSYNSAIGVFATLASAGEATIAPTQTLPLTLRVRNNGSLSDNYSFIITTPVGWPSASAENLRLDPNREANVTLNVTAPAGQAPGVYGVQVQIRSEVSEQLAQRRNQAATPLPGPSFSLRIPRSVVLNVTAPEDRIGLSQGGERTLALTLRNEGNAEGVVNLTTSQTALRGSWDILFEGGPQVRVPAAGTANVNMIITAPSDAGSGDKNAITIIAKEGESVTATDQVIVTVDGVYGSELKANRTPPNYEFYSGQTQSLKVNVTNLGNTEDTFNLTYVITPNAVASDWRVNIETDQVTIARGQTKVVSVSVKAFASDAREATLTIRALSQGSPERQENKLDMSLSTIPRPPTEETNDDDKLLPAPGILAILGVLVVALALRSRGGRR